MSQGLRELTNQELNAALESVPSSRRTFSNRRASSNCGRYALSVDCDTRRRRAKRISSSF